ncbi:MAG: protein kinase [Candidatus Riflebacteria bacterium]|nr:protein kinase [Candidatus Riflebacteria bacterium]
MPDRDPLLERLKLSPTVTSRYRIGEALGSGSMGTVYRATHLPLDRPVALKLIKREKLDQEGRQRFLREAQLAARITHRNVVLVFDCGEEAGVPYIAFELIDGPTLRRRLDSGPLELPDVLRITMEAAGGLAAAHQLGIIHRDVKPENILLAGGREVKVADFGIARPTAESGPGLTAQEIILGTPAYMSPEQVSNRVLTPATDQYSLGIVVYEMVCGLPPFHGSTGEVVAQQLRDPPPMEPLGRSVPDRVREIVQRMLAKDPAQRFHGLGELVTALGKAARALEVRKAGERRNPLGLTAVSAGGPTLKVPSGEIAPSGPAPGPDTHRSRPPTSTGPDGPSARPVGGGASGPRIDPVLIYMPDRVQTRPPGSIKWVALVCSLVVVMVLAYSLGRSRGPAVAPSTTRSPDAAAPVESPPADTPSRRIDPPRVQQPREDDRLAVGTVVGNKESRIYHVVGVTRATLPGPRHRVIFASEEAAMARGYRRAKF